jgi:ribosomal-protein-alanine N-acetyltransferase
MVGSVCLWNISPDRTSAELGYDLHPKFQGKGIMSEAVDAVLKFGFQTIDLQTIEAFTSRYNEASIKLLIRKRFVPDENRRDEDNPDNLIYCLSKRETLI